MAAQVSDAMAPMAPPGSPSPGGQAAWKPAALWVGAAATIALRVANTATGN